MKPSTGELMRKICWLLLRIWQRITVPLAFWWRRAALYARGVEYGPDLIVECRATVDGRGRVRLGRNVWLGRDCYIHVWPNAELVIDDDTYIGRGTIILCHESVRIGAKVMVAPNCHITDVNHGTAPGVPMRDQPLCSAPVRIETDVWLGAGCSVLPGTTVGQGCVIGARAVVSRSIPRGMIAVGVPAKCVKVRDPAVADGPAE
jgi:acetyltransferase-like isoleucine patch superfamily enzyme